jgi:hypothetical protein
LCSAIDFRGEIVDPYSEQVEVPKINR